MLGGLLAQSDNNREVEVETRDLGWEWFSSGNPSWSGMKTDRESSLQLLAVHGSVRMISESIATMPVDTYREQGDERVPTRPPLWLKRPSNDLDWTDWASQVLCGLLLDGNSYSQITYDSSGQIRELIPVADSKVTCQAEGRRKVIRVDGAVAPKGSILHIKGMMLPGTVKGMSPVEYARQTVGLGLAALEYGSSYFDRDGNMPGVIELPRQAHPDTMKKMAAQWRAKRTRTGKGLPGVLDDGATWKPTGVTNEQMEFLQTRKYSAGEIAGQMFLLDPTDLGIPVEGSSISYANLNQRNVRRVQVTFLPWIVRMEKALSGLLPGKQFVKLNVDGLLRGDAKSRYDAYKVGLDAGFLTVDEVREMEDRRPLPEEPGDAD